MTTPEVSRAEVSGDDVRRNAPPRKDNSTRARSSRQMPDDAREWAGEYEAAAAENEGSERDYRKASRGGLNTMGN